MAKDRKARLTKALRLNVSRRKSARIAEKSKADTSETDNKTSTKSTLAAKEQTEHDARLDRKTGADGVPARLK